MGSREALAVRSQKHSIELPERGRAREWRNFDLDQEKTNLTNRRCRRRFVVVSATAIETRRDSVIRQAKVVRRCVDPSWRGVAVAEQSGSPGYVTAQPASVIRGGGGGGGGGDMAHDVWGCVTQFRNERAASRCQG